MAKKKEVDQIRETSKMQIEDEPVEFLTFGSTIMNLAGSGKGRRGGLARGRIGNFVGDGSSGKTVLALETCAHAFYNIKKIKSEIYAPVKNLSIVYNNIERVMDFPLGRMYGQKFVDGVEWIATPLIEDFSKDFARRLQKMGEGDCLIEVVDSWDALSSKAGLEKFLEALKKDPSAAEKEKGSYMMDKQKYASSTFFNNMCDMMSGKDATLIIISQIRDKINAMFGEKHYRAGGKALDFYTHQVPWLAEIDKLEKTFRGHKMVYGIVSKARFKRNKVAKPYREGEITILFDYGIDDLTSMMNWYWGPEVKKIHFDGDDFSRQGFIEYVEKYKILEEVQIMVEKEWEEIEAAVAPSDRAPKFEA